MHPVAGLPVDIAHVYQGVQVLDFLPWPGLQHGLHFRIPVSTRGLQARARLEHSRLVLGNLSQYKDLFIDMFRHRARPAKKSWDGE